IPRGTIQPKPKGIGRSLPLDPWDVKYRIRVVPECRIESSKRPHSGSSIQSTCINAINAIHIKWESKTSDHFLNLRGNLVSSG
ncbi:MAG: hypothetical protein WA144_00905, partial [Candidatus Methanoperedens sp.]